MKQLLILSLGCWLPLAVLAVPTQRALVKPGDTLYGILRRNGFDSEHLSPILSEPIFPKEQPLVPKQPYFVRRQSERGFELRFPDPIRDLTYVYWRKGEQAGSIVAKEQYQIQTAQVQGRVVGSLLASIQNQVASKRLAYRFLDAYVFDYNLRRQLQRGARFAMTFEKKYQDGRFIKYGEVLSTSLEIAGKTVKRQFIPMADGGTFVDLSPKFKDRDFFAPVNYVRVSSGFQSRRLHPIKGRRQAHLGVDFELPRGEPIFAPSAGRVLRRGRTRGAGNYVVIDHGQGWESYYNHMDSIRNPIQPGTRVKAGTILGTIGCTGYCTKPHLHFALKKHGRFVDPIKWVKPYSHSLRQRVARFHAGARPEASVAKAN